MASSAVKQGGSYSYTFITTPPESLLCYLCQLVARDPELSVCCGTNFCKQCLKKRTNQESGCPVCKDIDVLTAFPNKMSDREIKKLIVLCVNNGQGCGWKVVSRSQTAIFSFILRPEKIGSGTPTIGEAVLLF